MSLACSGFERYLVTGFPCGEIDNPAVTANPASRPGIIMSSFISPIARLKGLLRYARVNGVKITPQRVFPVARRCRNECPRASESFPMDIQEVSKELTDFISDQKITH